MGNWRVVIVSPILWQALWSPPTKMSNGLDTLRSINFKMALINVFMNKDENKILKQSVLSWDCSEWITFKMHFLVCQLLHANIFIIHIFVPQTHVKDPASNSDLKQTALVVPWTLFPVWMLLSACCTLPQQASRELGWREQDV